MWSSLGSCSSRSSAEFAHTTYDVVLFGDGDLQPPENQRETYGEESPVDLVCLIEQEQMAVDGDQDEA